MLNEMSLNLLQLRISRLSQVVITGCNTVISCHEDNEESASWDKSDRMWKRERFVICDFDV